MACVVPDNLMYLPTHQWLKTGAGAGVVGITDFAQQALGGITWIELPGVGDRIKAGEALGNIESIKSVSDIISPVSGEIIEVNGALEDTPELINQDPYGKGWIAKISIEKMADNLLSPAQYAAICNG